MKQSIKSIILSLGLILGVVAASPVPAGAINVFGGCKDNGTTEVCQAKSDSVSSPVQNLISTLLIIIGILSVIMIIIGGIRYVLSNGDSSQITSAKNTILYAVIGLVVAMLAYAIVNFVITQFS